MNRKNAKDRQVRKVLPTVCFVRLLSRRDDMFVDETV